VTLTSFTSVPGLAVPGLMVPGLASSLPPGVPVILTAGPVTTAWDAGPVQLVP
jgi:hypothetical protein